MIEITTEQFGAALNQADEKTRRLMGTPAIYDCLNTLVTNKKLDIEVVNLLMPFGYFLLKLISIEELVAELKNAGVVDTNNFIDTALACIENNNTSELNSDIQEIENELKEVRPVRTMANDMQQAKGENTYSSSQEQILNKSLTPDDNSESPRW